MVLSSVLSVLLAVSILQTDAVSYWNRVLDCYERLFDACNTGKSPKTVTAIKGEFDGLLKNPVGKMNDEQQKRFEAIRRRYGGTDNKDEGKKTDTIIVIRQVPVEKIRVIDHVLVYDTVQVNKELSTIVVENQFSRKDTTVVIHKMDASRPEKPSVGWMAGATVGFAPDFSAGIIAGIGKDAGVYVKARSNFRKVNPERSVDVENESFWSNGTSQHTRMTVSAGGWISVYKGLRFYAGAGYGESCRFVQDTAGSWVEVSNSTIRSVAVDLGLMYNWKKLVFFGGINMTGFRHLDAEAGLAIQIGK